MLFEGNQISRCDMFQFQQMLMGKVLCCDWNLDYTGMKMSTKLCWIDETILNVATGIVGETTTIFFRSISGRSFWVIDLTSDMLVFHREILGMHKLFNAIERLLQKLRSERNCRTRLAIIFSCKSGEHHQQHKVLDFSADQLSQTDVFGQVMLLLKQESISFLAKVLPRFGICNNTNDMVSNYIKNYFEICNRWLRDIPSLFCINQSNSN